MKVISIIKGTNTFTMVIAAEPGDSKEQVQQLREIRKAEAERGQKIEPVKDEITITKPIQW